ncbi:MAG TPA: cation:dicarboxylase symporter family transporter [Myxococcales bacterium]|nr:cation:dicarboxylase symporter family transporter [Myxococcales bacterium]
MKLTLTRQILLGLVIGVFVGWLVGPAHAPLFRPFSVLFLRLVKMLIAPLIFSTLVAGIAGGGHVKAVGRMAAKAIVYFEIVTTLAIGIGLLMVNLTRPGAGVVLPPHDGHPQLAPPQTWQDFVTHIVPDSIVKAMAEGDVLQIVVFSMLFAFAVNLLGEKGKPVVAICESLAEVMFKLTNLVMLYAPVGVGCAMAYTVGHGGLGVLVNLGKLVGTLYLALLVLIVAVFVPVAFAFRIPIRKFIRIVKEPATIAFSTTSSEAALPRAMEVLEKFGVPRRIVALVLPLGYSFNLDGSSLYISLAAIFVAQAAGIHLGPGQQFGMLLMLMLATKGVAGVPRASLVVLSGALMQYGLPLEGITLILGVDELMDMARTATNLIGNCLATVVIARWEGEFEEATDEAIDAAVLAGEM